MRKVAIVTDCTADLPAELAAKRDITIVPLYLIWGDEELRAGIDITNEEFYTRLVNDPVLPHTSQPTPADFVNLFRQLDAEQIVLFVVSEQLSGTYASALAAAELYEGRVTVVNSRTASMSLGWQVLAAADVRDRGGSVAEMIAAADAVRRSSLFLLCPITLEYLSRRTTWRSDQAVGHCLADQANPHAQPRRRRDRVVREGAHACQVSGADDRGYLGTAQACREGAHRGVAWQLPGRRAAGGRDVGRAATG